MSPWAAPGILPRGPTTSGSSLQRWTRSNTKIDADIPDALTSPGAVGSLANRSGSPGAATRCQEDTGHGSLWYPSNELITHSPAALDTCPPFDPAAPLPAKPSSSRPPKGHQAHEYMGTVNASPVTPPKPAPVSRVCHPAATSSLLGRKNRASSSPHRGASSHRTCSPSRTQGFPTGTTAPDHSPSQQLKGQRRRALVRRHRVRGGKSQDGANELEQERDGPCNLTPLLFYPQTTPGSFAHLASSPGRISHCRPSR